MTSVLLGLEYRKEMAGDAQTYSRVLSGYCARRRRQENKTISLAVQIRLQVGEGSRGKTDARFKKPAYITEVGEEEDVMGR